MHPPRILLGVNIDHIATLRQARGTRYPDPIQAALLAEEAGADGITVHLREDRRHIQPRDVRLLAEVLNTRMNLEMAVTEEMLALAEEVRPAHVCLVPEKREELTTEGGLDVVVSIISPVPASVSLQLDVMYRYLSIRMRRKLMRPSARARPPSSCIPELTLRQSRGVTPLTQSTRA